MASTPTPGAATSTAPGAGSDRRYLLIALALLAAFMVAEVDHRAVLSGSLALLSDAGHMLSDVGRDRRGAVGDLAGRPAPVRGVDLRARSAPRSCPPPANGITLLVVAGIVTAEAISRLIHLPAVDGGPVIAVAAAGIVVNVAASWVLARANRSSLNVAGRVPARAHRPVRVHRHRHRRDHHRDHRVAPAPTRSPP